MRLEGLPNFFIIGAAKAGTTTLYETLGQHPEVYLPFVKEPAFFSDDDYYQKGLDWYGRTHYANTRNRPARGDATPTYLFWGSKVAPRLQQIYGDNPPRFIAIFRDPVALVRSFYWHSVRDGRETLDMRAALAAEERRLVENAEVLQRRGRIAHSYARIGLYAQHLQPYLDRFPLTHFLFLLTDDLGDFPGLVRKLETFLGLGHVSGLKPVTSNAAALPRSRTLHRWLRNTSALKECVKPFLPFALRHRLKERAVEANLKPFRVPPLDIDLADALRRHYSDEMKRLERLINRDLSAWYERPGDVEQP